MYGKYLTFATLGSYVICLGAKVFEFLWRVIFGRFLAEDEQRPWPSGITYFLSVFTCYSDIPNRVERRCTSIMTVLPKYFTLFHIFLHLILSQIRKLNVNPYWFFDMFYYLTFYLTPKCLYGSHLCVGTITIEIYTF